MEIQYRNQLPELLKHFNLPLVGAEIGVAEGNFSRDLLVGGMDMLYSIDNWETIKNQRGDGGFEQEWHDNNFESTVKKVTPFGDKSQLIKGKSVNAAKGLWGTELGLVYIDCDHSYEGVWNDIQAYWPMLVGGGIMAFHDYEAPQYGVKNAVQKFAEENNLVIHNIPEDKLVDAGAWIQKTKSNVHRY